MTRIIALSAPVLGPFTWNALAIQTNLLDNDINSRPAAPFRYGYEYIQGTLLHYCNSLSGPPLARRADNGGRLV